MGNHIIPVDDERFLATFPSPRRFQFRDGNQHACMQVRRAKDTTPRNCNSACQRMHGCSS
jgi:hypothetical protein